jgi:hypothetical protein
MAVVAKVRLDGDSVSAAGARPVPLRVSVTLPPAMFVAGTVSVPLCAPVADGLKVMAMVQVLPEASVAPQVVEEILYSAETDGVPSCVATPPPAVTVTVCAGDAAPTTVEGKLSGLGESASVGGAAPVPVSAAVTLPPEMLEAGTISTPVRVPRAVGEKLTAIEQLAAAARELPQVVEPSE